MVKRLFYFMALLGLISGTYLAVKAVQSPSTPHEARSRTKGAVPKVLVDTVKLQSASGVFESVATGYADKSADLHAVVEDKVTGLFFKPQQKVRKGQLLLQQDDREEQIALKLAQVQLNNTKSLLDRYRQAVEQGAVPQTQVDSAQADYEAAQLAVERARLAIANHQVRAPFDGVVGITDVDPGQRIGPGILITGIDSREVIYIDFEVPEALLGPLNQAERNPVALSRINLEASTPAAPGQIFQARVVALDSRLNSSKRSLRMRANIPNPQDVLRPGMSFSVRLTLAGQQKPAVPEISLQWDREGAYVWLVQEGKAARENVRVVGRRDGQVFLEGKLQAGEQVVLEGGLRLSDQQPVELVQDPLK